MADPRRFPDRFSNLGDPVRVFVSGFLIRLKELSVSLEDPVGYLAAGRAAEVKHSVPDRD